MNILKNLLTSGKTKSTIFIKWSIISSFIGIFVGTIGTLFHFGLEYSLELRIHNQWLIWLLPVSGILIALIYKLSRMDNDKGTNLVILAVHQNEKITIKTAPLIFISTILTHLCGGSAGREGAALQLGASLSNAFSGVFRLDEKDKRVLTMCGMSAAFSALFGAPITSVVFSMEVMSVGIMYYAAILPCTISALIASGIAMHFGAVPTSFELLNIPTIDFSVTIKTIILGILCAMISIIFCVCIKKAGKYYKRFIPNSIIRAAIGGTIILILTLIVGTHDYNGAGMDVIERAINGNVKTEAFALKIIFTALTLGAGFKGGEIVPAFFTGATFGSLYGKISGLGSSFSAGVGLSALFCAVTNCPMTSIILSIELFGGKGISLFAIAIATSYMLSGYYGLYSSQKIIYSKTKTEYIDTHSI